jgi:hypothetical protein
MSEIKSVNNCTIYQAKRRLITANRERLLPRVKAEKGEAEPVGSDENDSM